MHLLSKLAELGVALKILQIKYITVVNQAPPIASLPNEVLADIFETLHASEEVLFVGRSERCVSHASTHWRQVALGTPPSFGPESAAQPTNQTRLHRMEAYLERSKTMSFNLSLCVQETDAESYTEPIAPTFPLSSHLYHR